MRRARIETHSAKRHRRLLAGKLETAYRREERLRKLREGKRPRKRRLAAGKSGMAIRREERLRRLGLGEGPGRHEFSNVRGEFGGFNRDPRVPRRSR